MTGVNNLTVEKIRAGNSNIRNPILVSYVAKGLLPYHGPGSGIKRALEKWSAIDFTDDHDGCLFTTIIHRRPVEELDLIEGSAKTPVETTVGTVQRNIQKLQAERLFRRVGGRKEGHWEVLA